MTEFWTLLDEATNQYQSLHFNADWTKTTDWNIFLYHGDSDTVIFDEDGESNLTVLLAKCYIALNDWLLEQ